MTLATHIVTTTDFSDASEAGLAQTAEIAKITGAKVSLVHVYDPAPLAPIATRGFELAEQLGDEQQVEKAIQKALASVRGDQLAAVENVETHLVQSGSAASAIAKFAKDQGADLIVMSTHGRTGLAHLLIGSVAENVVRHAHCPVLTVPAK